METEEQIRMKNEYMANSKLAGLLRQRQIGVLVGMVKIIIGGISPYAGWVSLVLIGVTSFYTTIGPLFREWGIFFPFWLFCSIMVIMLVVMAIVEWVFMMPSYFKASNVQSWDCGGPFRDKLEDIEKEVLELKKMLKDLQDERK